MNALKEKGQTSNSLIFKNEIRLNARAVSRGIAVGKIVCLHGRKRQFYKINLEASHIKAELRRFRVAARLAMRELKKISSQKSDKIKETKVNIFDAHLLILEDKSLHTKIENNIKEQKINAEWAVKIVTDDYIAKLKSIPDEYLRERYIDLEDVADRILTALGGGGNSTFRLEKNSIVVAKEVKPSTLIELARSQPQAIITENGGWTSHTFILARELNLPAVTGLKGILRRVKTGDEVIVDGFGGQIILNPIKKTLQKYLAAAQEFQQDKSANLETVKGKLKTLDGVEIKIRANLDLPKGYAQAKRFGAQGIGLYRSEFLFNQFKGFPTEQEQVEAYRKIARMVGEEAVRIRTFDLSVEQLADETEEIEKNPALGLRAIRLSFSHLNEFRVQLRAILQASTENNISIVLPMISDVAEIWRTKKLLEREKETLKKRKIEFGNPRLGAMIEVPSAVLMIDEIVEEVDFLCLGTNDLVQYLLAVDRDNEAVADWFRTLHPAVLRSIKTVLQAATRREIPVLVCGEMAGSPVYAPILIGFGATELSMNVNSIPRIRKIISEIALEEAQEIVGKLNGCRSADEVEEAVGEFYQEKWAHLFSKDIFPLNRNKKT
ncbi:MAG: phosphoenolpyruvate--protein phosphotransferase [Acidobacteriota bacterium]|nr:phosphoenolpyruvate--protein phosphotransferase [Acidobacteriota bacterium]